MKSLLLIATLIVIANAISKEDKIQMITGMATLCQKEVGASDGDIENMLKKELPSTYEGKCLHSCMMEKVGVLNEGVFQPDVTLEVAKMICDENEQLMSLAKDIIDECKGVTNPDKCEISIQLMGCLFQGAMNRGVDPMAIE